MRGALLALAATAVALTAGSTFAEAATGPVAASRPTIAGTLEQGKRLVASPGTWTGSGTITYAYQWYRCDANGANCSSMHGADGRRQTPMSRTTSATRSPWRWSAPPTPTGHDSRLLVTRRVGSSRRREKPGCDGAAAVDGRPRSPGSCSRSRRCRWVGSAERDDLCPGSAATGWVVPAPRSRRRRPTRTRSRRCRRGSCPAHDGDGNGLPRLRHRPCSASRADLRARRRVPWPRGRPRRSPARCSKGSR